MALLDLPFDVHDFIQWLHLSTGSFISLLKLSVGKVSCKAAATWSISFEESAEPWHSNWNTL